mmetsp:Transcript_30245/g.76078  ORF Transcript_30245/g.76078 Transcript_30245/m.76078 type:complete len:114 (+) Transcript_30245:81-422(+)
MFLSSSLRSSACLRPAVSRPVMVQSQRWRCDTPLTRQQRIEKLLRDAFEPTHLEVIDFTDGAPNGKVMVTVVSDQFNALNKLAQHRWVNEVLAEEMKDLHALQVDTQRTKKPE